MGPGSVKWSSSTFMTAAAQNTAYSELFSLAVCYVRVVILARALSADVLQATVIDSVGPVQVK